MARQALEYEDMAALAVCYGHLGKMEERLARAGKKRGAAGSRDRGALAAVVSAARELGRPSGLLSRVASQTLKKLPREILWPLLEHHRNFNLATPAKNAAIVLVQEWKDHPRRPCFWAPPWRMKAKSARRPRYTRWPARTDFCPGRSV